MNKYSYQSEARLKTCHVDLQKVLRKVLEHFDHAIECGHRGKEEQDKAFSEGRSKIPWPKGKHNSFPSNAVDAMPYPYSYADLDGTNGAKKQTQALCRSYMFMGYVLGVADEMYARGEIIAPIRSGADWDDDKNISEETFVDIPHYERKL
jgi:peptidoglycan L-alanyl-D-glutamate endopeptidase CwlK